MSRPHHIRYSRWDGTQQIAGIGAEDVMQAIADELMRDGDLMRALRQLFREGVDAPDGQRLPGWWEMQSRLRQKRQEMLQRYDLGSILDEVTEALRDIIQTERATIDRRVEEGRAKLAEAKASGDTADAGIDEGMQAMLESIANRKRDHLDQLPSDPAGAIRGLQDYDFMDGEARQKFNDLVQKLQQQVLQQSFQGMQQALGSMTPDNVSEMREMMQDLNDMLEAQQRGEDPEFDQFMHKWGHFFGPGIENLDDLIEQMRKQMAAMQQLMNSLSDDQRGQLQQMMQAIMRDEGLQQQMSRLAENLGQMGPPRQERGGYHFSGEEPVSLTEALNMMERMNDYGDLERKLKDVRDWNDFANLDDEQIRDLMGEETLEQMQRLADIAKMLEDAGYVKQGRGGFELTPQGVRKIGEKALSDIFHELKKDKLGQHELDRPGGPGERTDASKPYEFGDPFLLDLPKTVMSAVQRQGAGAPVRLTAEDFAVYRTEFVTRSSTVLMIDMSRSMFYNQYFPAAKRIALALDSLIRSKYPRDTLRIVGFSYVAQELKPTDLPGLTWNEYQVGTNMQHGFQIAREMLAREKASNKQIIIITDGEPTAHIEHGEPFFQWPPTPETWNATLREVVRCTRDGITINTFMLEQSSYLMKFVNDLSKINGGRVFFASPDHLGEYILVDYVKHKRKMIA